MTKYEAHFLGVSQGIAKIQIPEELKIQRPVGFCSDPQKKKKIKIKGKTEKALQVKDTFGETRYDGKYVGVDNASCCMQYGCILWPILCVP